MNILVILAHPRPTSFNHAIAETTTNVLRSAGHHVVFHDLCAEQFPSDLPAQEILSDAVVPPPIEQHCRELRDADGMPIGLLKAKAAIVFNTSNAMAPRGRRARNTALSNSSAGLKSTERPLNRWIASETRPSIVV
jgi:hypothetical protein